MFPGKRPGVEDNSPAHDGQLGLNRVEVAKLATAVTSRGVRKIPAGDLLKVISWGYGMIVGRRRFVDIHEGKVRYQRGIVLVNNDSAKIISAVKHPSWLELF